MEADKRAAGEALSPASLTTPIFRFSPELLCNAHIKLICECPYKDKADISANVRLAGAGVHPRRTIAVQEHSQISFIPIGCSNQHTLFMLSTISMDIICNLWRAYIDCIDMVGCMDFSVTSVQSTLSPTTHLQPCCLPLDRVGATTKGRQNLHALSQLQFCPLPD